MKNCKALLFVALCWCYLGGNAQVGDSKMEYRSKSYEYVKKEKKQVDVDDNLAKASAISDKDPQGAIQLIEEALISAKFNNDSHGEAKCYALLGKINVQNNQYALAEKNFLKSAALYKGLKMTDKYHQMKLSEAKAQLKQSNYVGAKSNADSLLLASKDLSVLADVREVLGEIHYQKKEYDLALAQFQKQEELEKKLTAQKMSSNYKLGKAQANIAKVYAAKNDTKNADKKLIESSKTINKSAPAQFSEAEVMSDKDAEDAYFEVQEEVYSNYKSNNNTGQEIQLRNSVAKPNSIEFKAQQDLSLGEAYLNSGQYSKAIATLSNAEGVFEKNKSSHTNAAKTLKLLSEALSKSGNNAEALNKYKEYVDVQELAFAEKEKALELTTDMVSQQNSIDAIEKEFDLYKSDLQLLAEKEKTAVEQYKVQKVINYALLLITLVLSIAIYIIYKKSKEKRRVNQLLALKSLRSQMNPHFIFNALNSVNSFISKNDERSANKFLSDFSKLMRMVLDHSHEDLITLNQELDTIELYLKLEQYRFREKMDYELTVEEAIEKDQFMIPPMLIQPFIENAVWHGLRYKEDFGKLYVSIKGQGEGVVIEIQDDGIGRLKSQALKTKNQQQNSSKGLHNTSERIKVINELYKTNISLQVSDLYADKTEVGTRIVLSIPKLK